MFAIEIVGFARIFFLAKSVLIMIIVHYGNGGVG